MIRPILQAAAILLLAVIAASMTWWMTEPPKADCDPSSIKPGEICLQSIPAEKKVLWIDARSRSDWEKNGLPESILWNFDAGEDFNTMEAEAVVKIFETPYVVIYCADKGCGTSHELAKYIHEKYDSMNAEVHVLHQGWKALEAAGMVGTSP